MSIQVLAPGLLTTVQDVGRHGHAHIGVGSAGAMDPVALRLANILVGNVENAAGLEITLRGPRLRLSADCLIALAGAPIDATCGGQPLPMWRPVLVRADSELELGAIRAGMRSYLAVAGGVNVPAMLGSRSTDINSALGPLNGRGLVAGDHLACAPLHEDRCPLLQHAETREKFVATKWSLDPAPWFDADVAHPLRAVAGAHFQHLDAASATALFCARFRVGVDSNRVGYRLEGITLALREPLELVSSGATPGTVQLPPGGVPILLMAEAPTTGGYPRIAHIIAVDLPRAAQRRPGDPLTLMQTDLDDAQTRYRERERMLAALATAVRERLGE